MNQILISIILLFSINSYAAPQGSITCFYNIFSKTHFDTPVNTKPFTLNLAEASDVSTEHEYLNRILRLHYNPSSLDGKKLTHLTFSITYSGSHAGAEVPMNNGRHIISIAGDNTDLAGGFLNCDVSVKK